MENPAAAQCHTAFTLVGGASTLNGLWEEHKISLRTTIIFLHSLARLAGAMSLADLRPSAWLKAHELQQDTETRGGVAIYSGDAAGFADWEFRARAKVESQQTDEAKKSWTIRPT